MSWLGFEEGRLFVSGYESDQIKDDETGGVGYVERMGQMVNSYRSLVSTEDTGMARTGVERRIILNGS
jgi:hypothetical protein